MTVTPPPKPSRTRAQIEADIAAKQAAARRPRMEKLKRKLRAEAIWEAVRDTARGR